MKNRQFKLAQRPQGMVKASDFEFAEVSLGEPKEGEVLTKILYISLDPAMRGWMNEGKSYIPPVGIGEVMRAGTLGQIVASKNPAYKVGDFVAGSDGVQDYAINNGKGYAKVDPKLAPLPKFIGVLGMPGLTAWAGLTIIGQPKAGETITVAAATGPVGATVGQIGKLLGCRVVGVAGGAEKCAYAVDTLGFDACLDHRAPDLRGRLAAAAPKGIDVYFENVGGAVFDAVVPLLNTRARIPLCGLIARYNETKLPDGPDRAGWLMGEFLHKRITVQGFIVLEDFGPRYPEFAAAMNGWIADGKIIYREDVVDGLENAPEAFIGMLRGDNFGKRVIRVGDSEVQ